jgi:hypothetical protein
MTNSIALLIIVSKFLDTIVCQLQCLPHLSSSSDVNGKKFVQEIPRKILNHFDLLTLRQMISCSIELVS